MTLSAADVAEIMRLVEQSAFDELTLEMDGLKLTLRRAGACGGLTKTLSRHSGVDGAAEEPAPPVTKSAANGGPSAPPTAARAAVPVPAETGLHDIASPMLGTFYRAPKPGSAPFVEIGSAVAEDTVVGIIEVMKLMNTVRAGIRGTVAEIPSDDGALVEFGEVLMRVRMDV
ncbi:MAG TPA: acetyl-CoA carboxylase biotin carboxyl carrier protein [Steroidobacteraceae bacterium]|nr:acetyl-CoA carboxylase biotin carboxyl carrier protein [Steroidobacteraceae bacterium]